MREFLTRNTYVLLRELREERASCPAEGFRLTVRGDGIAQLFSSDEDGLRYGKEFLASIEKDGLVPVCEAEDYPSFSLRGVVEGFYGKPYSAEQRRQLFDFLSSHKMNAYLYAPKDDPFHRETWREEYPEEEKSKLQSLISYAKSKHIRFIYGISVGLDFCEDEDYTALKKKLLSIYELGARDFAVLFDDLPSERTQVFPAEAHCRVANFVNETIPHEHPLLFCPTDYFQNGSTPYRDIVKQRLDKDILVLWTGYNTVAEVITEQDCIAAKEAFGHELVLWDNYPVNDFVPKTRVYLGEIEGRTRALARYHVGYVANPSELFEASKVALCTSAEFAWNCEEYDGEGAFLRAVREQIGKSEEALFFAKLNRSTVMRRAEDRSELFQMKAWEELDRSFAMQRRAVDFLQKNCPALARELKDLLRYLTEECNLYSALRENRETKPCLEAMKTCRYRSGDGSLPAYLGEKTEERPVYWKTEHTEEGGNLW